ncbi:hypothetical protein VPNG_08537 [Cytospora leucostoma]|uniref:Cupin type-2 domain-containing protein n=1 Tax=Cytospora leucostoma TaxID=1230097 RepID=A0A423W552_9PEZI|nr:hypothetical protein VPNG_08537 [Cytospora leucostoma]
MAAPNSLLTGFPAEGLRASRRFITSHNKDGKGVFVVDDVGDHHRVLAGGQGVGNIIYSTAETPVDLNNDKDLIYAKEHEPPIHIENGSVVRLVDFAPGADSPIHRAVSIDYGVVVEGKFLLTLDSGESKIMLPGDMSVNRGCMHKWKNLDEERPGRMVFILLDVHPLKVNDEPIKEDLGDLAPDYDPRLNNVTAVAINPRNLVNSRALRSNTPTIIALLQKFPYRPLLLFKFLRGPTLRTTAPAGLDVAELALNPKYAGKRGYYRLLEK